MKYGLVLLCCLTSNAVAESYIKGFVTKVYDGDTTTVVTADQTIYKIRLAKIDAPELKQEFGQQAKACLVDKILNTKVVVKIFEKDLYQRYVGEVFRNGISINNLLVKDGCAWVYRAYTKDEEFLESEKEAQSMKKGLWSQEFPMQPWEWRQIKKNLNQ